MKPAKIIGLALFVLLTSQLFADFPLTIKDDSGTTITLKAKPQKILSAILFGDEILLNLVPIERLVAISTFSEDPLYSNVAELAKKVKTKYQLSVESTIAAKPDIVFVANWSDPAKIEQVRKAGINVYLVQTPTSVNAIKTVITKFGQILGEEKKASEIIKTMDDRLAKIKSVLSKVKSPLSTLEYNSWGSSNGAGSSWNEVITQAGLINAIGKDKTDEWGQVAVSKEYIVALNPDLIIVSDDEKTVLGDASFSSLKAVKNKNVLVVPERLKTTTSQFIIDSIEFLARKAYPELFK